MKFKDLDLEKLNLEEIKDFHKLILKYFCGISGDLEELDENTKKILMSIIKDLEGGFISYEQFNEILLLLNQDRISHDFFDYFFKGGKVNLKNLKSGITEFRGFCMLKFGNFKESYQKVSKLKKKELDEHFGKFKQSSEEIENEYKKRPSPITDLKQINKDKTWYLGYIISGLIRKETDYFKEILTQSDEANDLEPFKDILSKLDEEIPAIQDMGNYNTEVYLIWDFIDIYVATSMRKKCEFEETFEIINKIFNHQRISNLNLRYFDPTQSYCDVTRDKGLIEGLMLKRADCTIYMIQESDTFGKDSELASTLAQKKPVIAFIPSYEETELCFKIENYPLEYIKERIHSFRAEKVFEDEDYRKIRDNLNKTPIEIKTIFDNYLEEYELYRINQPFTLWIDKEEEFKKENKYFNEICYILSKYTKKYWNVRASILKDHHPLGMQIDLNSGVANGILVVRTIEECTKLLKQILTNSMEFTIRHEDEGFTGLFEKNTDSLFRIVTDNRLITNSFWNFFFRI